MNFKDKTVLITGATSGIGLQLAVRLFREGNRVIISGRNEGKLKEVASGYKGMAFFACDVSSAEQREALAVKIISAYPKLDVIINNAGVMMVHDLTRQLDIERINNEVNTNLIAPIHLSNLFIQHLQKQDGAAIINISSGLAFTPLATVPVYCSTKAGLHSFCVSLRHQLKNTSVKVFEIIPPAVDTNLGHQDGYDKSKDQLLGVSEFVDQVMKLLKNDNYEMGIGLAEALRQQRDGLFNVLNP